MDKKQCSCTTKAGKIYRCPLHDAAPNMLKALRAIADYDVAENHGTIDEWAEAEALDVVREIARAAIAKAGV